MASVTSFADRDVRGFLHRPNAAAERGLVLTHGAGGNCRAPLLVAAAEAFSAAGPPGIVRPGDQRSVRHDRRIARRPRADPGADVPSPDRGRRSRSAPWPF